MNIPREFLPFWPLREMPVEHPDFPMLGKKMVTEWVVEPQQFIHSAVVASVMSDDWSVVRQRPIWGRVQTAMQALLIFDGEMMPEKLTHRILLTAVHGEGPLPHGFLAMVAINQVQVVPSSEHEYAPANGETWDVRNLKMPWIRPRGGDDYRSITFGLTARNRPLIKAYALAHDAKRSVRDGY